MLSSRSHEDAPRLRRLAAVRIATGMLAAFALVACGGSSSSGPATNPISPDAVPDPGTGIGTETSTGTAPGTGTGIGSETPALTTPPKATVLNATLSLPWALAFLPDGRLLVTQKSGTMVLLSADGATVSPPISGLPAVATTGQGGLLDVALDPDFDLASNPWIYWTYAEADSNGDIGTAVARGRLSLTAAGVSAGVSPGSLSAVAVLFRQTPKVAGGLQFGSRLAFRADKSLFVTLGDRGQDQPDNPTTNYAQSPATTLGKIVRIQRDGSIPADNPFAATVGALPELWSLGHRNPQGAAIHPLTGDLWLTEHGAQGGDELNHVQAGKNYGWPLRSYSCPYSVDYTKGVDPTSCRVGGGTHAPAYTEPVSTWTPKSIAPSGMAFYTGSKFPEWRNNVLMGALNAYASSGYPEIERGLWRVALNGDTVTSRERLTLVDDRVRDVRQGPDGWIYVLTDSGQLIRIER